MSQNALAPIASSLKQWAMQHHLQKAWKWHQTAHQNYFRKGTDKFLYLDHHISSCRANNCWDISVLSSWIMLWECPSLQITISSQATMQPSHSLPEFRKGPILKKQVLCGWPMHWFIKNGIMNGEHIVVMDVGRVCIIHPVHDWHIIMEAKTRKQIIFFVMHMFRLMETVK